MPSNEVFSPTGNNQKGAPVGGYSSAGDGQQIVLRLDPITKRLLVDVNGSTLVSDGDVVDAGNSGILILGTDGTHYQVLSVDSSGKLNVTATATNLDIRDLVYSQDSVASYGSQNVVLQQKVTSNDLIITLDDEVVSSNIFVGGTAVSAANPVPIMPPAVGYLTVAATNLDIRDLVQTQDAVAVYGSDDGGTTKRILKTDAGGAIQVDIESSVAIAVTNAGITTIAGAVSGTEMQVDVLTLPAVTATNFDIRDLVYTQDSVAIYGSQNVALQQKTTSNDLIVTLDGETVSLGSGSSTIGKVGHDMTGLNHGVTTVTTAGTDVALASSTTCKKIIVQSQTDNTGLIAVGGSGVDATEATGTGIILYPGDSITIETDNLADVYIDSTVNGEGVRYTYFT